jgi:hypothetical protein
MTWYNDTTEPYHLEKEGYVLGWEHSKVLGLNFVVVVSFYVVFDAVLSLDISCFDICKFQ